MLSLLKGCAARAANAPRGMSLICLLNNFSESQIDLPGSWPSLDRFLELDRNIDIAEILKPHEFRDFVSFRESTAAAFAMLDHTSIKVVGHADVQRAVASAC